MPTHVALLRGVNVGGRVLSMTDLRAIVEAAGHTDVKTYIQSGNVVFGAAGGPGASDSELASAIEAGIEEQLAMRVPVVVLSKDELAGALAADPYPVEEDPRYVHFIFFAQALGPADRERFAAAQAAVAAKGRRGRDEATPIGRVLYLHTPDGFGRSELGAVLTKAGKQTPTGTARNRSTVKKLLDLLG
jgi:uncharacterized protein (DUF1697 family)